MYNKNCIVFVACLFLGGGGGGGWEHVMAHIYLELVQ